MAGPKMIAAGCEPWYRAEEIAVMGFFEVLPHLRRILKLRRELISRVERGEIDAFIGIDAQDFNKPAAAALKRAGIKTVQYVSPQVWAWRQSRVATIREAVDLVLCVLPFEPSSTKRTASTRSSSAIRLPTKSRSRSTSAPRE